MHQVMHQVMYQVMHQSQVHMSNLFYAAESGISSESCQIEGAVSHVCNVYFPKCTMPALQEVAWLMQESGEDQGLPVQGTCPNCGKSQSWKDVLAKSESVPWRQTGYATHLSFPYMLMQSSNHCLYPYIDRGPRCRGGHSCPVLGALCGNLGSAAAWGTLGETFVTLQKVHSAVEAEHQLVGPWVYAAWPGARCSFGKDM